MIAVDSDDTIKITTAKHVEEILTVSSFTKADRYSNGSLKIDVTNDGDLVLVKVLPKENAE